jgi:ketosteroid isomerase-like protein
MSVAQSTDPSTPAGIHAVYEAFSRAYETLDIDLLRARYTPDCRYLPAGSGSVPVQTCDDAMAGFEAMFASARADGRRLGIAFRFVDRSVSGDLAHDVGYYDVVSGPAGATDASADRHSYGKFVVVLKRGADGTWRIHVDGFSPTSREAYEQAASN